MVKSEGYVSPLFFVEQRQLQQTLSEWKREKEKKRRERWSENKKGKKGGKERRMGECVSLSSACDNVNVNWQPRGSSFSLSFSLSTFHVHLLPRDFSLSFCCVRSLCLRRHAEEHLSLAQLSGLCGWRSLRHHLARCNTAVPHCSCSVPVHEPSMHPRGARSRSDANELNGNYTMRARRTN